MKSEIRQFLSIILVLAFILTGCGGNSQSAASGDNSVQSSAGNAGGALFAQGSDEGTGEAGAVYYAIEEIALPDPDAAITALLEEGDRTSVYDPVLHGDSIYRKVSVFGEDGIGKPGYMQILRLSDSDIQWQTFSETETCEVEGKSYYRFGIPFFSESEKVYTYVGSVESGDIYLGRWGEDGVEKIICPVPAELTDDYQSWSSKLASDKSGNFYYYHQSEDELVFLDGLLQTRRKVNLPGNILGILQADPEADTYWYGTDADGNAAIWDVKNNEVFLDDLQEINTAYGFWAEYSAVGSLFLANTRMVWKMNDEPEPVFDFLANDYALNTLYGMEAGEDGSIRFLTELDGSYMVLNLRETYTPPAEKEEIVLAFAMEHLALDQIIASFNRQNDRYHISLLTPGEDGNMADFRQQIQMEISAGRGPDILGHDVILNISPYVENGYLECLDGVIEDESQYLQAALEGCRIGGKLYGIPYDCAIGFVTYPEAVTGGRTSWTMPELMEAVRASGAKILQSGCSGLNIVKSYALYDDSNSAYIDWENGRSHLTELPFLELLTFAKEYGDTGALVGEEGELIASGQAFAAESAMSQMIEFNYLEACFQGEPAILGYPRAEGNGIYVSSRELYVNINSEHKEGAKEFLRYLVSEEVQSRYAAFDIHQLFQGVGTLWGHRADFPIHLAAYDVLIDQARHPARQEYFRNYGVSYENTPWTEEQVEQFYFLLEHAQPAKYNASAISSIIDEELAPYFAGDITAEQAAQILDNRVQLYLDERGN